MLSRMNVPAIDRSLDVPLPFACAFFGLVGAAIGSFLNVVIHRVPREQSIVFPNSACPQCHAAIKPYDNIPILSYAILRGRCRNCGAGIAIRYPAVEALTAVLFALVTWHDGLSFALPFDLTFLAMMLALIFINAEHMILPNAITYSGLLIALVMRLMVPYLAGPSHFDDLPMLLSVMPGRPLWIASLLCAFDGAVVGGGALWLLGWIWERLRGEQAVGQGNVKMMLMTGAYLGWRLALVDISFAILLMAPMVLFLLRRQHRVMLPSGVFLGIGGIIAMLFGSNFIKWCTGLF